MIIPTLAAGVLLLVALLDARRRTIPHALTLPATLLAIAAAAALPAGNWLNAVLGAAAGGALFGAIWRAARARYGTGALGFGDVTLALLIGALGGIRDGLLALAVGMLIAGGWAAVLLTLGGWRRRDRFAYGVCLVLGALAVGGWRLWRG